MPRFRHLFLILGMLVLPSLACAAEGNVLAGTLIRSSPDLFGIPLEFIMFAMVLVGVAVLHDYTFQVGVVGLFLILNYKLLFTGFKHGTGLLGLGLHFQHEWVILANLLCLLLGFALLANQFERSGVPEALPKYLPANWLGGLILLLLIFVLSSFLDNIAAALIGGTIANVVYRHKVHIAYIAAIVAASNAGGSGSVVGDTTTTMMWIAGVSPDQVLHAYMAAVPAVFILGVPAAIIQNRHSALASPDAHHEPMDWGRFGVVFFVLAAAIVANYMANAVLVGLADHVPILGLTVMLALLVTAPLRQPDWSLLVTNMKGTLFLLSLVASASLMPVDDLPAASWETAYMLGFVSAVFDNIPLTALAIKQGGFDWGMLAFSVGFGGSMVWFGSSSGVAISNMFPEAKSVASWLRNGWYIIVAYVIGFFILLGFNGWEPTPRAGETLKQPAAITQPVIPIQQSAH
ncbi:MAG: citrate transporter [Magnetococcales bacterium]|nr:citrate transporter [Magnetococcales bacterium]